MLTFSKTEANTLCNFFSTFGVNEFKDRSILFRLIDALYSSGIFSKKAIISSPNSSLKSLKCSFSSFNLHSLLTTLLMMIRAP